MSPKEPTFPSFITRLSLLPDFFYLRFPDNENRNFYFLAVVSYGLLVAVLWWGFNLPHTGATILFVTLAAHIPVIVGVTPPLPDAFVGGPLLPEEKRSAPLSLTRWFFWTLAAAGIVMVAGGTILGMSYFGTGLAVALWAIIACSGLGVNPEKKGGVWCDFCSDIPPVTVGGGYKGGYSGHLHRPDIASYRP